MEQFKSPLAQRIAAFQEAEEAAVLAKREAEEKEREGYLKEKAEDDRETIERTADAYPLEEGAPYVVFPFSESAAFSGMEKRKFSLKAGNEVLQALELSTRQQKKAFPHIVMGYDKTDFEIYQDGACVYSGQFDIGSDAANLISHIRAHLYWMEDERKHPGSLANISAEDIQRTQNILDWLISYIAPEEKTPIGA